MVNAANELMPRCGALQSRLSATIDARARLLEAALAETPTAAGAREVDATE
ncbi:hypothetical protein [Siccirubricoccus phaeus]|jgi:hypothetical protein|uniref:hypothetical protein n=1 Tax=Siccirubricoccus phaeus TaxID=2595053 RepID=UPI00165A20E9|nr:hypothetical protein [Siccirubricoccus phaeus]